MLQKRDLSERRRVFQLVSTEPKKKWVMSSVRAVLRRTLFTGPSAHRQGQIGLLSSEPLCSLLLVSHQCRTLSACARLRHYNLKNITQGQLFTSPGRCVRVRAKREGLACGESGSNNSTPRRNLNIAEASLLDSVRQEGNTPPALCQIFRSLPSSHSFLLYFFYSFTHFVFLKTRR